MEDEIWERLGFPVNKYIRGEDVRRLATISQEHLQREGCLTSTYEKVLRDKQLQAIHEEIREKAEEIAKKSDKKLKANDDCVEKVCKLLRKDTVSEEHMEDAGMLEFSQVGVELLKLFGMDRNPDFKTSNLPNKGNLANALRGVENLIRLRSIVVLCTTIRGINVRRIERTMM